VGGQGGADRGYRRNARRGWVVVVVVVEVVVVVVVEVVENAEKGVVEQIVFFSGAGCVSGGGAAERWSGGMLGVPERAGWRKQRKMPVDGRAHSEPRSRGSSRRRLSSHAAGAGGPGPEPSSPARDTVPRCPVPAAARPSNSSCWLAARTHSRQNHGIAGEQQRSRCDHRKRRHRAGNSARAALRFRFVRRARRRIAAGDAHSADGQPSPPSLSGHPAAGRPS